MQHSDVALLRKNMNDQRYKIAIIDEHPVFREGLAVALGRYPEFEVVADAGTAESAYELFRSHQIDVATIDILMPGTSGMTLTSDLHEMQPHARVLGLSVIDEPGLIADMLRAHASGYALKTQPTAEIVDALHNILHGVRYLPPAVSRADVEAELIESVARPLERLTKREREVFELLIRGFSNDEIAERLQIAKRTVETHRQRITHKLSAHSIAQLQRIAAQQGGLRR